MPAFDPARPDRTGYQADWNERENRLRALERQIAAMDRTANLPSSAPVQVVSPIGLTTAPASGLGTAAYKNVPAGGGNAGLVEVVTGTDTRLSDERIPTDEFKLRVVNIPIDGGGAVIATGHVLDLYFPYPVTIQQWTIASPLVGSIQFDLWASNYAGYPPVIAGSIVAAAPPAMTAAKTAQSSTLTGWTPLVPAGTFLSVVVTSVTTVQKCLLSLKCLAS